MAKKEWRRLVLAVDPQMVQLACMDVDSVLGVLGIMARLMSENFRSGDVERVRRIGAWAWGLLGKCREVGQLGTEEVGEIRDLGKRAVKILQKMNEDERNKLAMRGVSSEHEQVAWEVEDTGRSTADVFGRGAQIAESDAGELEAAKSRLQARLHSEDPDLETGSDDPQPEITAADAETAGNTEGKTALAKQTHAMLDMIITVVGEFYGQRDLLRAREVWEESMTD